MKEIHPGSTVRTRKEMIENEQARAHAVWQWLKEMQRNERKKKKKHRDYDNDDDDKDDDKMYHPSQDSMTTAKLTPSSGPPEGSSGKPTRRATCN